MCNRNPWVFRGLPSARRDSTSLQPRAVHAAPKRKPTLFPSAKDGFARVMCNFKNQRSGTSFHVFETESTRKPHRAVNSGGLVHTIVVRQ